MLTTVPTASTDALSRRDRSVILGCIAIITVLAWAYLIRLSPQHASDQEYARMMAAMGMAVDRPWTVTDALLTFAMWTVMMVGMMAGSAAPMLLLFAASRRKRGEPGWPLTVVEFGVGYLAVWSGFSAVATLAQWALQRAALLSPTLAASKPTVAAAILMGAGIYQLTPFKYACLSHCRSPVGFLMTHWRQGAFGPLRMGIDHGIFCVGCCWALMLLLFAVGVMNLTWVAALTIVVLLEKLTPAGVTLSRVFGFVMIAAGAVILLQNI